MTWNDEENLLHLYEKQTEIENIREHHTDIVNAIRNHDPDQAYVAMKRHIDHVMKFFKDLE